MAQRRRIHDLGAFHREASKRGLTYAEAQIEESCEKAGHARKPEEQDPERPVYQKVSTRKVMEKVKSR